MDAGKRISVLGAELTIRIPRSDTGGRFTVFEGCTPPRHGPPLHRHRDQDESWYIVDGEFRFVVDEEEIYARTGDTVFAPRGSRHTFQNLGDTPGRMIATVVPGGLDLFFEELEAVVPAGAAPDASKMTPLFEKYGQEMLGPPLGR
jgi:mannose-6-phosphate isomerase-like protein (cupin superfamily)